WFGRRGQPGQVEAQPPDQGPAVGLRRQGQPLLFEAGHDEVVNGVERRVVLAERRQRRSLGGDQRPVRLVLASLLYPARQQGDLARRQVLTNLGRRHALVRILARDPLNQFALADLARRDHAVAAAVAVGAGFHVEAEFGLAVV